MLDFANKSQKEEKEEEKKKRLLYEIAIHYLQVVNVLIGFR